MIRVKAGRPLVKHYRNIVLMIGGHINRGVIKVIITFLFKCHSIHRTSGPIYQVNYLKANYVNLQQALGGSPLSDLGPLKSRFSRTNRGLPRIIPMIHRKRLRSGDVFIIRLWLSLFSMYRVITIPYKLKLDSITLPVKSETSQSRFNREYESFLVNAFIPMLTSSFSTKWTTLILKDRKKSLLLLEPSFFSIGKSTPTHPKVSSTSLMGLWSALTLWADSPLLPDFKRFLSLTSDRRANSFFDLFEAWINRLPHVRERAIQADLGPTYRPTWMQGKLGFKEEAAGKLRVFALVDAFTQFAMQPLHRECFKILKLIPQDGTFDQMAPIRRLQKTIPKGSPQYSQDLSSATDRLPVATSVILLKLLTTDEYGTLWRRILCDRKFYYTYQTASTRKGYDTVKMGHVLYSTGQPMGALSSWAFGLSLFHHSLVQMAAYNSGLVFRGNKARWFADYALLGDDIVIANTQVKVEYLKILNRLGVECSLAKSQVSKKGNAQEFAKRFYYHGVDCSPVAQFDELATRFSFGSAVDVAKSRGLSLAAFISILGFGFRAKACLQTSVLKLPRRQGNYILAHRLMGDNENLLLHGVPESCYQPLTDSFIQTQMVWRQKVRTSEEMQATDGVFEAIGEQGSYSPPYDDNVVWWEGKYCDLSPKMMMVDFHLPEIIKSHLSFMESYIAIGRGFKNLSPQARFFSAFDQIQASKSRAHFSFVSERKDVPPVVNSRPIQVVRHWRHTRMRMKDELNNLSNNRK